MTSCPVCNDTGIVLSPDPDGESVYESACPEPVHDEAAPDLDPFWSCPTHGGELVYLNERNSEPGDWEEHFSCTAEGCIFERHVS